MYATNQAFKHSVYRREYSARWLNYTRFDSDYAESHEKMNGEYVLDDTTNKKERNSVLDSEAFQ
jgi:hypothetical protein